MDAVFILWHRHDIGDGDTDDKLIGVYKTRADAAAAMERVKDKPGFVDAIEGFEIEECALGRDGWTEGFISVADALDYLKQTPG